jgi:hypothetical protein
VFKVEHVPLLLGILVVLAGAALVFDARREDGIRRLRERRRRRRTPRNRPGEALIGIGMILLGTSLIGGEFWRFGTVAVLAGTTLVVAGTLANRHYLKEMLLFRGAARRTAEHEAPPPLPEDDRPRPRIR